MCRRRAFPSSTLGARDVARQKAHDVCTGLHAESMRFENLFDGLEIWQLRDDPAQCVMKVGRVRVEPESKFRQGTDVRAKRLESRCAGRGNTALAAHDKDILGERFL